MNVGIVSVGTELLMGEVVDTNAAYLASQLPLLGLELKSITVQPDSMISLTEAFHQAWGRFDVVLATGGLGPTEDDLTREAVARVLQEEMSVSPGLERELRGVFAAMGRQMPSSNMKQATLIPSARSIPNPRGTAPGWWVEKEGKTIVLMPGPPAEMQRMWEVEVVPLLRARVRREAVAVRTLKCLGSEAEVGEKAAAVFRMGNPALGIYARPDGIHLRLIARAPDDAAAAALLDTAEAGLRESLDQQVWGMDADTLEGRAGALLAARHLTLATMESCTGGLLSAVITDVPGSSAYFKGGFVSYSREMKEALGVDARLIEVHGVVSAPVAEDMARVARERLGVDFGLSVTGVAGPDPLEGKPPGLAYIGIAGPGTSRVVEGRYPPRRVDVKRLVVTHALHLLVQALQACP